MVYKPLIKSKKGQMLDLFVVGGILVAIFLGIVISSILLDKYESSIDTGSQLDISDVHNIIDKGQIGFTGFDYTVLTAVIAFSLSSIIAAFFIKSHPGFFVISIILLFIAVGFASFTQKVYNEMAITSDTDFIAKIASYPITAYIFGHFPLIIAVIGILIAIALAMKPAGDFF